jgi:hypothetical protein
VLVDEQENRYEGLGTTGNNFVLMILAGRIPDGLWSPDGESSVSEAGFPNSPFAGVDHEHHIFHGRIWRKLELRNLYGAAQRC